MYRMYENDIAFVQRQGDGGVRDGVCRVEGVEGAQVVVKDWLGGVHCSAEVFARAIGAGRRSNLRWVARGVFGVVAAVRQVVPSMPRIGTVVLRPSFVEGEGSDLGALAHDIIAGHQHHVVIR